MQKQLFQQEKKLGMALGGGGARSMAHLGIIEVLHENGITIDCLTTASGGSIIGALIAADVPVDQVRKTFHHMLKRVNWFRPQVKRGGFLSQNNIRHIINDLCGGIELEETKIPLSIVATDLNQGEIKVFREGDLASAVCASSAFPGIYQPIKIQKTLYADGGILNSIPADICRQDIGHNNIVLAVSLDSRLNPELDKANAFQIVYRSIYIPLIKFREGNITANSDLVWRVFNGKELNFRNWLDLLRFYSIREMDYFYDLGRKTAEDNLPAIQQLLSSKHLNELRLDHSSLTAVS